jgi:predicted nucleotidyltransferase
MPGATFPSGSSATFHFFYAESKCLPSRNFADNLLKNCVSEYPRETIDLCLPPFGSSIVYMKTEIASKLEQICRDFGVIGLWVFGSRAGEITAAVRGLKATPGPVDSDLDIGLLFPKGTHPEPQIRVRAAAALEDLLSINRVDLVVLGEASAFLTADIIKGELLVDLAPRATAEFELYALRRAADLHPFRAAQISAILEEGAR